MPISDHYRGGMTERLLVQILTVDVANGRIEVVGKDAAVIQVGVGGKSPPIFVWPQEKEYWTIIRENSEWSLEHKLEGPGETEYTILPGQGQVQAETIWTPSGERLITTGDGFDSQLDALDARLDTLEGQTLDARLDVLESQSLDVRLDALEAVPAWTALNTIGATYTSPWATFGGDYPAQARKLLNGTVEFRGLVKITTGTISSGTMFTMPAGWVNAMKEGWQPASAHSGGAYVEADIDAHTNGNIILSRASAAIGTSGWVSLSSLHYSTV